MHTLMPTAAESRQNSSMGRLAALHARARHRKVLGVRLSAIIEVLAFVALVLIIDLIWGTFITSATSGIVTRIFL